MDLASAVWHKSTRSQTNGQCVEIADNLPDIVAVRDSKHQDGPTLVFTPERWQTFVAQVKSGGFER
ncbi:MAG: DUF397 domain-containing protein [Dactylosporangium sp.]|nr:DUF397 domain-containing protein [Dactylosporangium sp.]NNJ63365.1 DUF397 domain-containing protein [Dactylosporangium sp.]